MWCVVIVILLLIVWFCWSAPRESFRSCRDCDFYRMPSGGVTVLNPFVYPYSGMQCVDDLYVLRDDKGIALESSRAPLTHLNTPDHVVLTE